MDFDFAPGALPGSLELAYLGDSVYDLYVRARLVREGGHVRDMHRAAVRRVCAHLGLAPAHGSPATRRTTPPTASPARSRRSSGTKK